MPSRAASPSPVMLSSTLQPLGAVEFDVLREIIHDTVGIRLADEKRLSLQARLARRLRQCGLDSYADYVKLLQHTTRGIDELAEMVNAVTTNKTSFFRERHHFTFLADLMESHRGATARPIRVWSAGCSTGEEPYSIAMTALDAGVSAHIIATDVDTNVLATARAGVYRGDLVTAISAETLHRHFLRGEGASGGSVRVKPGVRALVRFSHLNLIDPSWPKLDLFDVIFCRNVVIYFDQDTKDRLFRRLAKRLAPGGLLVIGHSENITWLRDLFEPAGRTMYRLRDATEVRGPRLTHTAAVVHRLIAPAAPTIRVDAGDVHASREPLELRTVLGSCVAACLYDPVARVGGMNHFMLPDGTYEDQRARYGVHAMELLINEIMKMGGERSRFIAKVFGGASVVNMERTGRDVGRTNAEFIRRFLETERIPIAAERLGGTRPLDVRMQATTGAVRVRALASNTLRDLAAAERARLAPAWQPARLSETDLSDVLF